MILETSGKLQATRQIFIEYQIENATGLCPVEIWKSLPWVCKLYAKHANLCPSFEEEAKFPEFPERKYSCFS